MNTRDKEFNSVYQVRIKKSTRSKLIKRFGGGLAEKTRKFWKCLMINEDELMRFIEIYTK